ncbi:hypothetical protein EU545_00545 [Candidatus Thorarchaeota archaeon]|nr:MAG: hypothetical protein EU545_00545 [Candidatus Thorarchaeota archaeon]
MTTRRYSIALLFSLLFLLSVNSGISAHSIGNTRHLSVTPTDGVPRRLGRSMEASELLVSPEPAIQLPDVGDTIALVVENALYSSVSDSVQTYRKDLNDTGYRTLLYTQHISTAEELKSNLTQWYDTEQIIGAVLIGRLPYARYHHPASDSFSAETFICDLFLMDLDGNWYDVDPNDGIYDVHSASPGSDIYPEIFVSRIDPTCLTWGSGTADHINTYLNRIHEYRIGQRERARRGLMYVDDDWSGYWGNRWAGDLGLLYDNRSVVQIPTTWTNASDWLNNRLIQDYQWGHLCAHSSPTTHYFGPSGSGQGTASSSQIRGVPPAFNFYNLFCCSGAKWTTTNNLGVTYLFSGPNSLAVVGSTKTGSMMDCDEFYDPLSGNATMGESLVAWFSQSLKTTSSAGSEYLEWYYGMTVVGDPLLTTYYDCTVLTPTVSSMSHPNQLLWYEDSRPVLNWTTPPDVNNITGYYYVVDQNPNTIPTAETAVYTTNNSIALVSDLADGTWYFHIVARDSVNNIGNNAAHFTLRIDTSAPDAVIITPSHLQNYTAGTVQLSWQVTDLGSGYDHCEVFVDGSLVYNGSGLEHSVTSLSEGTHNVSIIGFDAMGFSNASDTISFGVDETDPEVEIEPIGESLPANVDFLVSWTATDAESGYRYTEVYLDGEVLATVFSPDLSLLIEGLEEGDYSLNVTVFDWSGRSSSEVLTLRVRLNLTPYVVAVSVAAVVIVVGVVWKRRR